MPTTRRRRAVRTNNSTEDFRREVRDIRLSLEQEEYPLRSSSSKSSKKSKKKNNTNKNHNGQLSDVRKIMAERYEKARKTPAQQRQAERHQEAVIRTQLHNMYTKVEICLLFNLILYLDKAHETFLESYEELFSSFYCPSNVTRKFPIPSPKSFQNIFRVV
jgi:hypothetical protein